MDINPTSNIMKKDGGQYVKKVIDQLNLNQDGAKQPSATSRRKTPVPPKNIGSPISPKDSLRNPESSDESEPPRRGVAALVSSFNKKESEGLTTSKPSASANSGGLKISSGGKQEMETIHQQNSEGPVKSPMSQNSESEPGVSSAERPTLSTAHYSQRNVNGPGTVSPSTTDRAPNTVSSTMSYQALSTPRQYRHMADQAPNTVSFNLNRAPSTVSSNRTDRASSASFGMTERAASTFSSNITDRAPSTASSNITDRALTTTSFDMAKPAHYPLTGSSRYTSRVDPKVSQDEANYNSGGARPKEDQRGRGRGRGGVDRGRGGMERGRGGVERGRGGRGRGGGEYRRKEVCEQDVYELIYKMSANRATYNTLKNLMIDDDSDETIPMICSFAVEGHCRFAATGKCRRMHRDLPYQWQFYCTDRRRWEDFPSRVNSKFESSYCNPDLDGCSDQIAGYGGKTIHCTAEFDGMLVWFGADDLETKSNIRRLSTRNAAMAPGTLPMLTTWTWYWRMDSGVHLKYDKSSSNGFPDSKTLEDHFTGDNEGVFQWSSAGFKYEIDFSRMVQVNTGTRRERKVIRRPERFMNAAMVESERQKWRRHRTARQERNLQNHDLPGFWNLSSMAENDHFQLVPITKSGSSFHEYEKIEIKFFETMSREKYQILKIQRIENPDLYQIFQVYKRKMEKLSSTGTVEEKLLFHGTKQNCIDAICLEGFETQLSGSATGALYGKGIYFAKGASYSRSYTNSNQLFVTRVLVGKYTEGKSDYVRPPSDPSHPRGQRFNSCVNDINNPQIFVVFRCEQAYPEYLLDYRKND